jgi:hypothetical protein
MAECCGSPRDSKFCPECGSPISAPKDEMIAYFAERVRVLKLQEINLQKPDRLSIGNPSAKAATAAKYERWIAYLASLP